MTYEEMKDAAWAAFDEGRISGGDLVRCAVQAQIVKLRASLRYSHGQDRSDALADIASCEQLVELFKARQTLH